MMYVYVFLSQRRKYRAGGLSEEQRELLTSIGIDLQSQWDTMYDKLLQLKGKDGKIKLQDAYKDPYMKIWLEKQYWLWDNNHFSKVKRTMFHALGIGLGRDIGLSS